MILKKQYLGMAVLLMIGFQPFAQETGAVATDTSVVIIEKNSAEILKTNNVQPQNFNFIKFNLAGLIVKNYSFQYERTLNKKFSAAISFRIMPRTSLPFKNVINDYVGASQTDVKDLINNLQLSNFAITPELRIYLSKKGFGRGFYIAPFYRFASFASNHVQVNYTTDQGAATSLNLTGKLTANTAGFLIGAQWAVGKNYCIDWSIAGPHYGGGSGSFDGVSTRQLSQHEQSEIRSQIDDINVPFINKTVKVDANGASMILSGPWAGIRAALSFGIKF